MTRAAADALSREQLLALPPGELVADVLDRGQASPHYGTAPLALAAQLRHAGVSLEALELCVVGAGNVLESVVAGGRDPLGDDDRAHLGRVVAAQAGGIPVLGDWLATIAGSVARRAELERALELLSRARTSYLLLDATERPPTEP